VSTAAVNPTSAMQGNPILAQTGNELSNNIYFITSGKKRVHDDKTQIMYNNAQYLVFRKQEQRRVKGAGVVDEQGNPVMDTEYNAYPEPPQGQSEKEKTAKAKFDKDRADAGETYFASATISVPELRLGLSDDDTINGAIALFTDVDGKFKASEFSQALNRGIAQKLGNRNRAVLTQVQTDDEDNPIADAEGYYIPVYPFNIEGLVFDASGQVLDETQKRGLSAADRIQRSLASSADSGKLDMSQLEAIQRMIDEQKTQLLKKLQTQ
jgi:hypothetical protein